jgi:RNA-directed DNA polymerase
MAHITLLELSAADARNVLLKNESYTNFDLPNYFDFQPIIRAVSELLVDKSLEDIVGVDSSKKKTWPGHFFGVNHRIVVNKNSNLSWRPLELTHPVMYVALVHLLTDVSNWSQIAARFNDFERDSIEVASIPSGKSLNKKTNRAEQIKKWWENNEQRSVELGLEYAYISETDISDCYSSMYTHSVAWAMHGRAEAFRSQHDKNLLGNQIDEILMGMHHRQTNGIPQGSALYDFIAELVLGYIDTLIYDAVIAAGIDTYKIIRFRDDYKIFTKNPSNGKAILRIISDTLVDFGLRLNATKTISGKSLIDASFKSDKLEGLMIPKIENNFSKQLMQIHQFSERYPNSGQVSRMLNALHDDMYKKLIVGGGTLNGFEKPKVMISILVDMCTKNPRFYNIIAAMVSLLLSRLADEDKLITASTVHDRLQGLPNTGLLDIWLQRAIYKYDAGVTYIEPLTKVPTDHNRKPISIWNNEWLQNDVSGLILGTDIINKSIYNENSEITTRDEVDEFRDIPS